jgi:molecular chaperone GrpE
MAEDEALPGDGDGEGAGPAETAARDGGNDHASPSGDVRVEDLEARARLADEYLAQLQRLKADFDNYRRRMMQEQARWSDAALGGFITEILPVVDNLERALASGGDAEAIRRGIELTLRQLQEVLRQTGVEPIEPVGGAFDPTLHEAMAQVETADLPEGHVVEDLRRGYLFKRQVLRPSLVKVARAPGPAADGAESGHGAGREGEVG